MAEGKSKFAVFLEFLRPFRWRLAGIVSLTVALSILAMLPPLLTRAVIDRVLTRGEVSALPALALCILAMPVLISLCRFIQSLGIGFVGQHFVFDLRNALYRHLLRLSLRFYGKHSVGKIANRLMGDTTVVQHMLTAQSIDVISDLVSASFAISATFAINWRLALLLLGIVALFVANYKASVGRIRQATRGYQAALDRVSGGVQNRLVASMAVKTFGMERHEQSVFSEESEASLDLAEDAQVASAEFNLNTSLLQSAGYLVLYFLGCAMVLRGELSYGSVVAFGSYAMQLLGPAVGFSELARQIMHVNIAMDRIFELYASPPEVSNRPGAKTVARFEGRVDFENVDFHYDPGAPVLSGFDLHVAPGEMIALIGPTGCGKSTIISLLMRFYDVCGGRILLDGTDLRDIRIESLRSAFGIVLQEPLLFNVSIADNIRYSKPNAGLDAVEAAARVAEIHDFIKSLPDGYDTQLGMEGLELSGGQKQRITIARAVLADPAILVMDEATSALDSESERAIQAAMARVLKGRTSFVIAHRLSTIRNAGRIVLLDKGSIVEIGSHSELMARPGGRYRSMYEKHMGAGTLSEPE